MGSLNYVVQDSHKLLGPSDPPASASPKIWEYRCVATCLPVNTASYLKILGLMIKRKLL